MSWDLCNQSIVQSPVGPIRLHLFGLFAQHCGSKPIRPQVRVGSVRYFVVKELDKFDIIEVFNALWTTSVAYNGAAVATVLVYSSAAFTAVIGWRLFSESLGVVKIIVVVLSIVGCILVSGAYDLTFRTLKSEQIAIFDRWAE